MGAILAVTVPHAVAAVFALLLATPLIRHRDRLNHERIVLLTAGVILLTLFATGIFAKLPDPKRALEDISGALGQWTYLFVGLLAFLETGAFVGLIAPGEAAVIVGGVVAGQGEIDIRVLIGLVWIAAFLGDSVSYAIGAKLGRGFLVKHGPKVKISEERLTQVENYMRSHGGKTIMVGRFIGLVRALAPFLAGASRMPYRRFLPYDILGSGLWAIAFCLLGYVFSQNLSAVIDYAERGVLIFGWTVAILVAIIYLIRRFRDPDERTIASAWLDKQERHPRRGHLVRPLRAFWRRALLPIGRVLAPRARFVFDRLTPGGLGIEFTTSAAVLAVSAYSYYNLVEEAKDWPGNGFVRRLNDTAFDLASSTTTGVLTDTAKIVTQLGALPVAGSVVLVAAAFCLYRRRIPEAIVMIASLALSVAIVRATKSWTDVQRPTGSLVATGGSAFPSGHSTYAVAYVTVALTFGRLGLFTRIGFVLAAGALGASIAASRVYLRAHYLTDAIGGVAAGFMAVSLVSAIVLLVLHTREVRRVANLDADAR